MLILYNKKTKFGLSWASLYSHKGRKIDDFDGDYFASLVDEDNEDYDDDSQFSLLED